MNTSHGEKQHFVTLEWFRFILSLYIVIFHTFNYNDAPKFIREIVDTGFFATSSFFILSGFILAHVYLKNKGTETVMLREKSSHFLIKRFANLWPIHIISMVIFILMMMSLPFFNISPGDANSSIRYVMFDATDGTPYEELKHYMSNTELWIAIISNIFMINSWNPYYMVFNFPTWSISTLFFFYMLFPFIAVKLNRLKRPYFFLFLLNAAALVPVSLLLIYTNMGYPEAGFLHRNPIIRLPEFVGGILLCHIYHKNRVENKLPDFKRMCVLITTLVVGLGVAKLFIYMMANHWDSWYIAYHLLHNGLILSLEMLFIYVVINLPDIKSEKWVAISEKLGSSSLPLFALHMPIFYIFIRLQKLFEGNPMLCLSDFTSCTKAVSKEPSYIYYGIYLIVTIYLCILFQRNVVIPIRKAIIKNIIKQ